MEITASIREYYRDLRASLPPRSSSIRPITLALVTQLPFPIGVVPESLVPDFLKAASAYQEGIANSSANGRAIDSLIILFRLVLALGLAPGGSIEPRLYELAFHDFGRNMVDDYIVKGKLLDTLFPPQGGRVNATLGDLIQHPLVSAALWSHPSLHFLVRHTWAKKPGRVSFEPHELDRRFVLRDHPFKIDLSPAPDLGKHFSRMLGIKEINGDKIAFAGTMPTIIPVIIRGGQSFENIRSFTITGPTDYEKHRDGTLSPVETKRHYHLRALLHLAESDIRLYHQNTTPVAEQIRVGNRADDYYAPKLKRGEHVRGWAFEECPHYFLLVYASYYDPHGGRYQPPSDRYGEYMPALTDSGRQRLPASPYTGVSGRRPAKKPSEFF
ncbi:hypothetical protein C8A00DRAFT_37843 [Chaetomidium leptoderma]|uniref:Uncharacterized protein n=1 Tax=Chaetomidium leptoderma TaxID=669021 RepID=A0AAN6VDP1_9PEZI|nr:hypothetical protein C8A00DRAFT_37843 [Chaetomidium leptoderma]